MRHFTSILTLVIILHLWSSLTVLAQVNTTRQNTNRSRVDSIALKILVVKLLKWHETDQGEDYIPITTRGNDSIYTGINWKSHLKRMKQLEQTGLFTKQFIWNYNQVALHLDTALKYNKIKYHVGELPPYSDANEWCNCQDYPENVWSVLRIADLGIYNGTASFKWTWGHNFFYSLKAQKEQGQWKIAQLENFAISNFTW